MTLPVPATLRRPAPERIPESVTVRAAPVNTSVVSNVTPVAALVSTRFWAPVQLAIAPTVAAPRFMVLFEALPVMPRSPRLSRPPLRLNVAALLRLLAKLMPSSDIVPPDTVTVLPTAESQPRASMALRDSTRPADWVNVEAAFQCPSRNDADVALLLSTPKIRRVPPFTFTTLTAPPPSAVTRRVKDVSPALMFTVAVVTLSEPLPLSVAPFTVSVPPLAPMLAKLDVPDVRASVPAPVFVRLPAEVTLAEMPTVPVVLLTASEAAVSEPLARASPAAGVTGIVTAPTVAELPPRSNRLPLLRARAPLAVSVAPLARVSVPALTVVEPV